MCLGAFARSSAPTSPALRASRLRRASGVLRSALASIMSREQRLVEAAPVDADAHRLAVRAAPARSSPRTAGRACCPCRRCPGLIRSFASAGAQSGTSVSSLWPLKWKSPISGTSQPAASRRRADRRHRARGLEVVDRDPHQLRAGFRQRRDLRERRRHVGGVGIGHRLHDHRRAAADADAADVDRGACAACDRHASIPWQDSSAASAARCSGGCRGRGRPAGRGSVTSTTRRVADA